MSSASDDTREDHMRASELAIHLESEFGGVSDVRIHHPNHIVVATHVGEYLETLPGELMAFLHGQGFVTTSQELSHEDIEYGDSVDDPATRTDATLRTELQRGESLDDFLTETATNPDYQNEHIPCRADVVLRSKD